MATTTITVLRNGNPASNVRVALEFTGLMNLGFTKNFYTNSSGIAYVEHASNGQANVYLNGSLKGKVQAPGSGVFNL